MLVPIRGSTLNSPGLQDHCKTLLVSFLADTGQIDIGLGECCASTSRPDFCCCGGSRSSLQVWPESRNTMNASGSTYSLQTIPYPCFHLLPPRINYINEKRGGVYKDLMGKRDKNRVLALLAIRQLLFVTLG